jgi:hypothetical protein
VLWQSQLQQLLLSSLEDNVMDEGLLAVAADKIASSRSILSIFSMRWSDKISSTSCIDAVKLRLE